jgi:hypothetical protein
MLLPAVYGGEEIHPSEYLQTLEEVAHKEGSVAWNLFVANSSCLLIPSLEAETARIIYADPHAWMC